MDMDMSLVNLEISTQFFVHLKVAFSLGFIVAFPFVCYEVWKFIAPALYSGEKKTVRKVFVIASLLFYIGIAVGYVLIVPISPVFSVFSKSLSVASTTV